MRLLLLGCTGFVGRELVPQLLQSGHQLTLVSRRLPRGYGAERQDGRISWLQLDPAQASSWQAPELTAALEQADGIQSRAAEILGLTELHAALTRMKYSRMHNCQTVYFDAHFHYYLLNKQNGSRLLFS